MNIEKIENRILEINEILNNGNWDLINSPSLLKERNEKEFLINKQNIYVSLRGDDKYYYAYQCKNFAEYIKNNGFNKIATSARIKNNYRTYDWLQARKSPVYLEWLKVSEKEKDALTFVLNQ